MAREKAGGGDSSPYAEVILSVVNDLIRPGADQDAHRHALALAGVAFLTPWPRPICGRPSPRKGFAVL
jgi:hypothetical protein